MPAFLTAQRQVFFLQKLLSKDSSLLRFCSRCFFFACPFIKSSKETESETKLACGVRQSLLVDSLGYASGVHNILTARWRKSWEVRGHTTEIFSHAIGVYNKSITSIRDKQSWRELFYGLLIPTALDQSENEKLITCGKNKNSMSNLFFNTKFWLYM